ncbi:MAG: hypothetical protein AB1331_05495 [Bacillota bacterium]
MSRHIWVHMDHRQLAFAGPVAAFRAWLKELAKRGGRLADLLPG